MLDAMIDEGNWTGVVAAASRYSKVDVQTEESEGAGKKRSWLVGSSLLDNKPAATAAADQSSGGGSAKKTRMH
jgi:hypothetical protein